MSALTSESLDSSALTLPTTPLSALARCVGDIKHFRTSLWGSRTLVRPPSQSGGSAFDDLLSLADVDRLITSTALRLPLFRLVRAGETLPTASYTRSATIGGNTLTGIADAPAVLQAIDDGATLVLQGLQRYWPPLTEFVRSLELELGHSCQVNAYLTPPGSQGLAVHSDEHDVLVLQVDGCKRWEVHAAPGEPDDNPRDLLLNPGATLYLPKGTPHAARAQQSMSLHLTIGVLTTTWRSVLDAALKQLHSSALLDSPLPAAFHNDREAFGRAVGDQLQDIARALEKVDGADVADAVVDKFFTTRPRPLTGGLLDRAALPSLTDTTLLRRRPGAVAVVRPGASNDRVRLLLGDRELSLPAAVQPALEVVMRRAALRPADLGPHLSQQSRLVLVRRLVREGLYEVALDA